MIWIHGCLVDSKSGRSLVAPMMLAGLAPKIAGLQMT